MDKPDGNPELEMNYPNGELFTRLQMEQQLREKIETVHERRLLAITPYGLDSKVAYDMKPVTVTHWILDEMIRRGLLQGEQIGVGSSLGADNHPENFKQFGQRLALFIENNWAVSPHKAEGIDMTKYPSAPPVGVPAAPPPNGQHPGFVAPAPPPPQGAAPPAAYAPPAPPAAYSPPAPPAAYAPPAPPIAHAPPAPPVAAAPPPPTAYAPPAPPVGTAPVGTAPPAPPAATVAGADPGPPPAKADPARPWGKASPTRTAAQSRPRRDKAEQAEDEAHKLWKEQCKAMNLKPIEVEARYAGQAPAPVAVAPPVAPPPMAAPAAPPPMAAPQPTGPVAPPNPMAMRAAAPPAPPAANQMIRADAAQQRAATLLASSMAQAEMPGDPTLEEVYASVEDIKQHLKLLDVAVSIILRNSYGTAGDFNCASILRDFKIPLPE